MDLQINDLDNPLLTRSNFMVVMKLLLQNNEVWAEMCRKPARPCEMLKLKSPRSFRETSMIMLRTMLRY